MNENDRKVRANRSQRNDAEVLDGLTNLGLGRQAIALATKVLDRPKPQAQEIDAAIRAIGMFSRDMKRWRPRIERMAERLPKRIRHAARESLLLYFAHIGDHERAASFIAAPRRFPSTTLFTAVDSLIELRRFAEARALVLDYPEAFDDGYFCESLAMTEGTDGQHFGAMLSRLNAPIEPGIEQLLVDGAMHAAFALAITFFGKRIEMIRQARREAVSDPDALSIPGIVDSLLAQSERRCERWRAKLTKMIPEDMRYRHALDSMPEPPDGSSDEDLPNRR